jgi:predicted S18 family serine protease
VLYYNIAIMKWVVCVSVLVAILLNAPAANAQQETTIVVSPAIIDLAVKPGDSIQSTLTIRNGGGFASADKCFHSLAYRRG